MHEGAVRCQVSGCEEAIPNTRRFFSRYKICPTHSGCESVLIGGKEQRFCQLCRRFQDTSEFEGDKRSCKASLNQHNQRRQLRRRAKAAAAAGGAPAVGAATEPAGPSQLEASQLGPASQLPSPSSAASPTNSNSTPQISGGQQQPQQQQEAHVYFSWVDAGAGASCQPPAAGLGQPFVFEAERGASHALAAAAIGGIGGAAAATRAECITSPQQEGSARSAEPLPLLPPQPEQTLATAGPGAMPTGAMLLGLSPQQQPQQQPPLLPQQGQPRSPPSPAAAGPAIPKSSPGRDAIMATSADDDMLGWLPKMLSMSIDDGQVVQPQCSLLQELLERQEQQQQQQQPASLPAAQPQGAPLAQPRGARPITAIDLRGIRRPPAAASWAALQPLMPAEPQGAPGGELQQFAAPLSAYVLPPAWMLQQAAAAAAGGGEAAGAALPPPQQQMPLRGWSPGSAPSILGQEGMHGAGAAGGQPGDMPPPQGQAAMPGGVAVKRVPLEENGNQPLHFAALAAAYVAAGGTDGTAPALGTQQELNAAAGATRGVESRKRPAAHSISLADLSLQLGSLELAGLGALSALSSLDFGFPPAGVTNTASPPGDGLSLPAELPAQVQAGLQQYQQQDGQQAPAFVFQAQPQQQRQTGGAAQQQQGLLLDWQAEAGKPTGPPS